LAILPKNLGEIIFSITVETVAGSFLFTYQPLVFEELSSTQDYVRSKEVKPFQVVVALHQTKGRGRRGNSWYSPKGKGLYLSFKIPKNFLRLEPIKLGCLSLVVGLSVSQTVDQYVFSSLKWPNDVYIRNKKVAGVLIENTSEGLIVGIGVNLNTEDFPPFLKIRATSIYRETQTLVEPQQFLKELLLNLNENLIKFQKEGFTPFKGIIERKLLWKGQRVILDNRECGKFLGIDENGFAVIKTCVGNLKKIPYGDISLRREP